MCMAWPEEKATPCKLQESGYRSNMEYDVIICFEIHAELNTKSKMFCRCSTTPGAPPNTNICPICTGQPGTLPVLNQQAVEYCVRTGLALNCRINEYSRFARKNYFYPDLPKGYQISQYEEPLCEDGEVEIQGDDGKPYLVGIKRIHLEEDAGKLVHSSKSFDKATYSLVDYNRAGVPLMEIVSDHTRNPIRSLEEARRYLERVRQILQYIDVSKCIIEEGQFRCDVNISLRPKGSDRFLERSEIKNMASFKAVLDALQYEIQRQSQILESGGELTQETRLYDEEKGITLPMRGKEDAPDYRYFPEPDLVELEISQDFISRIKESMPELPHLRVERIIKEYGISQADAVLLTREKKLSDFFEQSARFCQDKRKLATWITKELFRLLNESSISIDQCIITPEHLGNLVSIITRGEITEKIGKTVLKEMFNTGKPPQTIIEEKDLRPIQDTAALVQLVRETARDFPEVVNQIKAGDQEPINYMIGQIMKKTRGKADPVALRQVIEEELKS